MRYPHSHLDSITMEPRAVGVSSTLAFVEQAIKGHQKMDD